MPPTTPPRFGFDAERYDRVRPSYPARVVDEVVALAGVVEGDPVLEVGAGTGKATVMFAERGLVVHALEPSPAMARVARRKAESYPKVTVEEAAFERWGPAGRQFELVFSAQAWHLVAPDVRYARAQEALTEGGLLAVFWSRPIWDDNELRDRLRAVYADAAADFGRDPGPLHPASEIAPDRWEDWDAEIASAAGLADPTVRCYKSRSRYTTERYLELLSISRDHTRLAEADREALLTAVAAAIDDSGGSFAMNYVTKLCLARASAATMRTGGEQ